MCQTAYPSYKHPPFPLSLLSYTLPNAKIFCHWSQEMCQTACPTNLFIPTPRLPRCRHTLSKCKSYRCSWPPKMCQTASPSYQHNLNRRFWSPLLKYKLKVLGLGSRKLTSEHTWLPNGQCPSQPQDKGQAFIFPLARWRITKDQRPNLSISTSNVTKGKKWPQNKPSEGP